MRYKSFSPDTMAVFAARPNRFVVMARSDDGELKVHCPNPGRLREILLPGRNLILERAKNPNRKTRWTLAAADYRGLTIPLVSVGANRIVGDLVLPDLFPGYEIYPEKTRGSSRFDWYLEKESESVWVEVKACTLVEHGRALFPDAPSLRAVKHTEELIAINDGSARKIIFAVMNPTAEVFTPNPHTDPDLCLSLARASEAGVEIRAVSFRTSRDGWTEVEKIELPVDLSSADLVYGDSGIVVGIHEESGPKPSWTISTSRYETGLSRSIRRQVKKCDIAFPIFGALKCFNSIENELAMLRFSGEGNPAANPAFLNLILDYRHRRVFSSL